MIKPTSHTPLAAENRIGTASLVPLDYSLVKMVVSFVLLVVGTHKYGQKTW